MFKVNNKDTKSTPLASDGANHWIGFYMLGTAVMTELMLKCRIPVWVNFAHYVKEPNCFKNVKKATDINHILTDHAKFFKHSGLY